ncbi:hypothetical protein CONPUDRAFT_153954 [Coniophora puteana RWD-64-598 SS2]|uniref:Uncharacterized protein n=1 Tax=Coniophora puteana (strain RWD-64-598) TaxID=741705 RepID=A0A5M3MQD4_CONPW|nr:uncharacterized protein CONPUDRAFT_153954 [Coniophora puteana RWD-64-598 SS2]EIW81408.1 hypothetical protein CONPUDRAFT_153954 [Coniophora puteana RWD-64-598 SS2]
MTSHSTSSANSYPMMALARGLSFMTNDPRTLLQIILEPDYNRQHIATRRLFNDPRGRRSFFSRTYADADGNPPTIGSHLDWTFGLIHEVHDYLQSLADECTPDEEDARLDFESYVDQMDMALGALTVIARTLDMAAVSGFARPNGAPNLGDDDDDSDGGDENDDHNISPAISAVGQPPAGGTYEPLPLLVQQGEIPSNVNVNRSSAPSPSTMSGWETVSSGPWSTASQHSPSTAQTTPEGTPLNAEEVEATNALLTIHTWASPDHVPAHTETTWPGQLPNQDLRGPGVVGIPSPAPQQWGPEAWGPQEMERRFGFGERDLPSTRNGTPTDGTRDAWPTTPDESYQWYRTTETFTGADRHSSTPSAIGARVGVIPAGIAGYTPAHGVAWSSPDTPLGTAVYGMPPLLLRQDAAYQPPPPYDATRPMPAFVV